jgi:hypothetical protein
MTSLPMFRIEWKTKFQVEVSENKVLFFFTAKLLDFCDKDKNGWIIEILLSLANMYFH